MREINEGDTINVIWNNENSVLTDVVVKHVPEATGDLWYVKTSNGDILAINPNSSNFESFVKKSCTEVK